jgi:hypothetical protein
MTATFVAAVGLLLLTLLSVCIGMSLDTEGQRRERQRLAEERRLRTEARGRGELRQLLCEQCPYRYLIR